MTLNYKLKKVEQLLDHCLSLVSIIIIHRQKDVCGDVKAKNVRYMSQGGQEEVRINVRGVVTNVSDEKKTGTRITPL